MEKIKIYDYSDFHLDNLGFVFMEKETGTILSKLTVFNRHPANVDVLNMITQNKHPLYNRINSKGWQNGVRIYCSTNACEKRFECFRYKQKKTNLLTMYFRDYIECNLFEKMDSNYIKI